MLVTDNPDIGGLCVRESLSGKRVDALGHIHNVTALKLEVLAGLERASRWACQHLYWR